MDNEQEIFDAVFAQAMSHEGGYVDSVFDRGGETKYGISKAAYPDLDIASLTPQQAKEIYYRDFWVKQKLGELYSPIIAFKIFDLTINMGTFGGGIVVQQALFDLGKDIIMDGVIGLQTITAINSCNPITFLTVLIGRACAKYANIYEKFVDDLRKKNDNTKSGYVFYRNCLVSWFKRALEA